MARTNRNARTSYFGRLKTRRPVDTRIQDRDLQRLGTRSARISRDRQDCRMDRDDMRGGPPMAKVQRLTATAQIRAGLDDAAYWGII